MQNDTVVLEDNNFFRWVQTIVDNGKYYDGKKIQLTGYVYRNKDDKDNEFIPARLMMTCCAADLYPVGFLCFFDKANELKQNSWVKVTGTLKMTKYNGQDMMIIYADAVQNTAKPDIEYVYPF